jgi:L-threonylcarbamoyladenylate synthase
MQEEINKAITVLENGGIILYPTDTIWGLGCDAKNETAVQKIYDIKKRIDSKSLIILLDDDRKLNRFVREVPEVVWDILDYAIKPTTIVYPNAINLPKVLVASDGSIAIRVTKDDFCRKLIQKFKNPIVSTSANEAGMKSPKDFKDIPPEILKAVDHVVHLPASEKNNEPSSIIKIGLDGELDIIRK